MTTTDPLDRFEIHLTIDRADAVLLRPFLEAGMSLLEIELPRGVEPSQPMLSWRRDGAAEDCLAEAADVGQRLDAAGLRVIRTKIEAAPSNTDVPRAAGPCPSGTYFESHLKLLFPAAGTIEVAERLALAHGAHLSRNARRRRADGGEERFATLRERDAGHPAILRRTQALQEALAATGHVVLDSEIEFVLHDSNCALDAGWLPGEPA